MHVAQVPPGSWLSPDRTESNSQWTGAVRLARLRRCGPGDHQLWPPGAPRSFCGLLSIPTNQPPRGPLTQQAGSQPSGHATVGSPLLLLQKTNRCTLRRGQTATPRETGPVQGWGQMQDPHRLTRATHSEDPPCGQRPHPQLGCPHTLPRPPDPGP